MTDYTEAVMARRALLRPDGRPVYNCCQAVVSVFAQDLGYDEEKSLKAAALFRGGMEDRIHSIVALAAPMNGTTAYDLFSDPAFDPASVKVPWWSRGLARAMSLGTKPKRDGRDARDYADFDMRIDNAMAMNRRRMWGIPK